MAALEARLSWCSAWARHDDRLIVAERAALADGRWSRAAERARQTGVADLEAAPWIEPVGLAPVDVPASRFRLSVTPLPGRFYPRLAFPDLACGPRDLRPVRLLEVEDGRLRVDPNHPLAGWTVRLELRPIERQPDPGGRLVALFDGPGMQVPPPDMAAAYYRLEGFVRQDEADDALFYARPRFVQHLDAACRAEIAALHGRFLAPGARVLDLMGSWASHLPEGVAGLHVAGLGLNREELAANPVLTERVVKDLNVRSDLPWADAAFDLVVCTASIEYLLRPREVMAEVFRVLRPGGHCVVSFSDRWFATKAIRLWGELHPFERLGLVLSLLWQAGFEAIHGETLRGLMRPDDDPHADQRAHADPLFAAWGRKPA